jgi:predicted transcriptional regulator YheO
MPDLTEGPEASGRETVEMVLRLMEDGGRGIAEAELPAVFAFLARVAEAIVATVGPDCEVVVHDLRKPDHSVVAISGHLTGRHVGAPIPDPELLPGEVDRFTHDDLRRLGRTAGGRELLASTVWIRNPVGHIIGAVCINLDVAGLRTARDLINRHLGHDQVGARPLLTFASSIPEFARLAAGSVLGNGRSERNRPRRTDRIELVRRLDAEGVFALRGAANAVAAELGISRASLYTDLRASRRERPSADSEPRAVPAQSAASTRRRARPARPARTVDPAGRPAGS